MTPYRRASWSQVKSALAGLFTWWLRELRDLSDDLLAKVMPRLVTRAIVTLRADGGSLWIVRGQRQRQLALTFEAQSPGSWPSSLDLSGAAAVARGTRTTLALDPEFVLTRSLLLPESVERDLESVLSFQLERESPIPPDQACIDKSITERLKSQQRIRVDVLIAHRGRIELVRQLVSSWGLQVVRIGVGTGPEQVNGNFLHTRSRLARLRLTQAERRLAVCAAALVTIWLGVIAVHWGHERIQVGRELERLQGPAKTAIRLAHDLETRATPGEELVSLMHQPDALDALETLTTDIPEDSWVYDLEVTAQWPQQPRIKLSGFTPVATMLISRLEAGGEFRRVHLVSALSAGLGSGQDRLMLTAQLANHSASHSSAPTPHTGGPQ